ncbi:hypothetical protein EUGRSUZ_A01255, partial [Eucalyptus grandis]
MLYRACYPIFKLVYSAAANASHNMGFNEASLVISKAKVNEGTTMKKLKPRARGRSYAIKRPTCHIRIVLKDKSFYEEEDFFCLKKAEWKKRKEKKKYTNMTYQYMDNGIQEQIVGRLDGKEIACVDWMREGRVHLQTIRAKLDYCSYGVQT